MKTYIKDNGEQYEVTQIIIDETSTLVMWKNKSGDIRFKDFKRILDESEPKTETPTTNWGTEMHETLKLNCGLEIALEDYWEINEGDDEEKTEFTFDEAKEIEKKTEGEWRVPKMSEWAVICEEISETFDRNTIVDTLKLSTDEAGCGNYWSGTVNSSSYGYTLYFGFSSVYPAYRSNRYYGWPVRLVRGV